MGPAGCKLQHPESNPPAPDIPVPATRPGRVTRYRENFGRSAKFGNFGIPEIPEKSSGGREPWGRFPTPTNRAVSRRNRARLASNRDSPNLAPRRSTSPFQRPVPEHDIRNRGNPGHLAKFGNCGVFRDSRETARGTWGPVPDPRKPGELSCQPPKSGPVSC